MLWNWPQFFFSNELPPLSKWPPMVTHFNHHKKCFQINVFEAKISCLETSLVTIVKIQSKNKAFNINGQAFFSKSLPSSSFS